jgi:hypothetical protein
MLGKQTSYICSFSPTNKPPTIRNDAIASRGALIDWRRGMERASESQTGVGMLMAVRRPTKLLSQGEMRPPDISCRRFGVGYAMA